MICIVEGCESVRSQRRLMCGSHYERKRKYGDPLAGQTRKGALLAFLDNHKDDKSAECLTWPFGGKGNGYGHLKFRGVSMSASKAMCILAGDPPSSFHEAAHSCGNGHLGCVNPAHLRWATRRENMRDAIDQGTTSRGEGHSRAIRAAWAVASRSDRIRAKALGVSVEELTREGQAA